MRLKGLLSLPLLAISAQTFAQSSPAPQFSFVRGMLEGNAATKAPAPGVLVTVENNNFTSPAVKSGKDGLYYIPNLVPGNYTLKVWTDPKNPLTFPITVQGKLTDIPPVIVPKADVANPKKGDSKKSKSTPQ